MLDRSGSMLKEKIQALNFAVPEAIAALLEELEKEARVAVYVRVISFHEVAEWHDDGWTSLADFVWSDLSAGGRTAMGQAFHMASDEFDPGSMPAAFYPPVIVLVTDGLATDDADDALARLLDNPVGRISVRVPIAIGGEEVNYDLLHRFKSPEVRVLTAIDADQLREFVVKETVASVQRTIGSRPGHTGQPVSPPDPQNGTGKDALAWWRI